MVDGGRALQPVLYSLALEAGDRPAGGRGPSLLRDDGGRIPRRPHSDDAARAPDRCRGPGDHRPRDRDRIPRAGAGREGVHVVRLPAGVRPDRRAPHQPGQVARSVGRPARAAEEAMSAVRPGRCRRPRADPRTASIDTVDRRGGRRNRKDHRAGAADPQRARQRPRPHRADRRRHLHRKGGGRAEAADPQGAGEPAPAIDRRAAWSRTSPTRSSASRKRTSARFTASAPICCASGRSRRASIRCSRCSPSRAPTGSSTKRFAPGCTTSSSIRRKASAARCVAASGRGTAATTTTVRSTGSAAPAASWPSGAISTARGGAIRSIATPQLRPRPRPAARRRRGSRPRPRRCAIRSISTRRRFAS